ncbi:chaperonin CPN60, mitochondrial-like isoform X2 [Daktulosphaira vitifoliae]|uniref:chaperonin CPN60, mitochondrial-like isoform X2 n=1 Tax=Daktulosphaira vitifoliae TaxID=58002 RepID=UPI0021AABE58|nr:chaperonin CPN60, mitochondrial-like isoform X2 [Daktulosphaira vitifoliae]
MRWIIYCTFMFVCVISSLGSPVQKDIVNFDKYIDSFQDILKDLKLELELENKNWKIEFREELFKTNNEISIQEISTNEYEIPEYVKPIIQQIFPDSTEIYFIKDVLKNLDAIKDNDTTYIRNKLQKFHENEYISLRNLIQILTDKYIKIPNPIVGLFNNFLERFHCKDTTNTGLISKNDFSNIIEAVLKNRDIVQHVLKPTEGVENLNYEAWLLKKRKVLYDMVHPPKNKKGKDKTDRDETDGDETDGDETDWNETDWDETDDDETDEDETDEDETVMDKYDELPDIGDFETDDEEMR